MHYHLAEEFKSILSKLINVISLYTSSQDCIFVLWVCVWLTWIKIKGKEVQNNVMSNHIFVLSDQNSDLISWTYVLWRKTLFASW